jgi:hypothetical protein
MKATTEGYYLMTSVHAATLKGVNFFVLNWAEKVFIKNNSK